MEKPATTLPLSGGMYISTPPHFDRLQDYLDRAWETLARNCTCDYCVNDCWFGIDFDIEEESYEWSMK